MGDLERDQLNKEDNSHDQKNSVLCGSHVDDARNVYRIVRAAGRADRHHSRLSEGRRCRLASGDGGDRLQIL